MAKKAQRIEEVELIRPSRAIPLLHTASELMEELRKDEAWHSVPLTAVPRIRQLLARIETDVLVLRKRLGL
jgi:hypothetical protein